MENNEILEKIREDYKDSIFADKVTSGSLYQKILGYDKIEPGYKITIRMDWCNEDKFKIKIVKYEKDGMGFMKNDERGEYFATHQKINRENFIELLASDINKMSKDNSIVIELIVDNEFDLMIWFSKIQTEKNNYHKKFHKQDCNNEFLVYDDKPRQSAMNNAPIQPTVAQPTVAPTVVPSVVPTVAPTVVPTVGPTVGPSVVPTVAPTVAQPTVEQPTVVPTVAQPTVVQPTVAPTKNTQITICAMIHAKINAYYQLLNNINETNYNDPATYDKYLQNYKIKFKSTMESIDDILQKDLYLKNTTKDILDRENNALLPIEDKRYSFFKKNWDEYKMFLKQKSDRLFQKTFFGGKQSWNDFLKKRDDLIKYLDTIAIDSEETFVKCTTSGGRKTRRIRKKRSNSRKKTVR